MLKHNFAACETEKHILGMEKRIFCNLICYWHGRNGHLFFISLMIRDRPIWFFWGRWCWYQYFSHAWTDSRYQ